MAPNKILSPLRSKRSLYVLLAVAAVLVMAFGARMWLLETEETQQPPAEYTELTEEQQREARAGDAYGGEVREAGGDRIVVYNDALDREREFLITDETIIRSTLDAEALLEGEDIAAGDTASVMHHPETNTAVEILVEPAE